MTKSQALTKRQIAILDFIIQQIRIKGYPPSVREIGEAVGLQSSSTVHSHLTQLEQKGYIKRDPTKPRAIMILKDSSGDEDFYTTPSAENDTFEEMVSLPLVGQVAAGQPILAEENVEDTIPFPMRFIRHNDSFLLKVKGDSMINVGIFDGDLIIVAPAQVAANGEIVVAMIDDEATVKTFYKEKGRIRLQPENDSMEPIYATDVQILGKVIGLFRTF